MKGEKPARAEAKGKKDYHFPPVALRQHLTVHRNTLMQLARRIRDPTTSEYVRFAADNLKEASDANEREIKEEEARAKAEGGDR